MPDPTAMPAARRVVAVFDFDGTVTDRDTLVPFLVAAFGRHRGRVGHHATASNPPGFMDCQRQLSSHIASRPRVAFQPMSASALAGSA